MLSFRLFSPCSFAVLLAYISALSTATAIPVRSEYNTIDRRTPSVVVNGKVGVLGKQLSDPLHTKSTVHELTSWDGDLKANAVIKTYPQGRLQVKDKEVEGLKAVGQYIYHDKKNLVMKKVEGPTVSQVAAGLPRGAKREKFLHRVKDQVVDHIAHIATTKGIMHDDPNLENIIIHPDTGEVQLVDWEMHKKVGSEGFISDKQKIAQKVDTVWTSGNTREPPAKSSSKSEWEQNWDSPQGSKGLKGSQGFKGSKGSHGSKGSKGSHGSKGSKGLQESKGSKGSHGSKGSKGSKGSQGSKGSHGSKGSQNSKASKGSKGSKGSQGSKGSHGSKGSQNSKALKSSKASRGSHGSKGSNSKSGN